MVQRTNLKLTTELFKVTLYRPPSQPLAGPVDTRCHVAARHLIVRLRRRRRRHRSYRTASARSALCTHAALADTISAQVPNRALFGDLCLPSQKSSSACCFAACAVQNACARVTLSSSSCGTGSPLRWCGAMRAVCTNVFHLSCHTQHHAVLLRHPNLVHQPHGPALTSNLATPAPFHHLKHPAAPYLQVDICPMLRVFKRPQFHVTPPVSQST